MQNMNLINGLPEETGLLQQVCFRLCMPTAHSFSSIHSPYQPIPCWACWKRSSSQAGGAQAMFP